MSKVATIILNRNLPEPTARLYEHLVRYDGEYTDIFVLEAGSDPDNLSQYYTWHAQEDEINRQGLRYGRGMNYALLNIYKEEQWSNYDFFFLLSNDTELHPLETIKPLTDIFRHHPKLGILSPCSARWGEKLLLNSQSTMYFWFIHNHALMFRRSFLDCIVNRVNPNYMNFLFDGSNFRGYGLESELIAKAYANNFAAAITNKVFVEENEDYLLKYDDLIKTDNYSKNLNLYYKEGLKWMRKKYGFNNKPLH